MLTPLHETPLAVAALVNVVVAHRDDVPAVAILMFGSAVDRPRSVVGVDDGELVPQIRWMLR